MPKARARVVTSCPIRPNPSTPSVFSYTSTPPNRDRSQRPDVSDACACGTLRASASISASVCSAAATTFDCGALATTIPRRVAFPPPPPPPADPLNPPRPLDHIRRQPRRRPDQDPVVRTDPLGQLLRRPPRPHIHRKPLTQQRHPRSRNRLGHQDAVGLRQHGAEASERRSARASPRAAAA